MQFLKRVLTIILGGLTVVLVALLFAFLSLRVAIHGREVAVPNLAGLSDADAASAARDLGINLSVENRFYSPDHRAQPYSLAVAGRRLPRPPRLAGPRHGVARPHKESPSPTSPAKLIALHP